MLLDDLEAEYESFDHLVGRLDDDAWDTPTPAKGWAIRDQVHHLAAGEELAALAAGDADRFAGRLEVLMQDLAATERSFQDEAAATSPAEILARWRRERTRTLEALRAHDGRERISWVVGPISVASFATARLMETWAHGQDVADALGVHRPATPRLRHVAHLGVSTRGFSYVNRGMSPPDNEVRVELTGPDGEEWTWGPADAPDKVAGRAEEFCLVVVQRRHVDDTGLRAEGPHAAEWLAIAQCFAGPPT